MLSRGALRHIQINSALDLTASGNCFCYNIMLRQLPFTTGISVERHAVRITKASTAPPCRHGLSSLTAQLCSAISAANWRSIACLLLATLWRTAAAR